jgi:serine/threonine-protein kinase
VGPNEKSGLAEQQPLTNVLRAKQLTQDPSPEAIGKQLLGTVLEAQQRFIQLRRHDPNEQFKVTLAHLVSGSILGRLGQKENALAQYEHARAILERLVRAEPDNIQLGHYLATTYHLSGTLYTETGQPDAALRRHDQAREILETLVHASPAAFNFKLDLAKNFLCIGNLRHAAGQSEAAAQSQEQARVLLENVLRDNPKTIPQFQSDLAASYRGLGDAQRAIGQSQSGQQSYQQAQDLLEKLVAQYPDDPNYCADLDALNKLIETPNNNMAHLKQDARATAEANALAKAKDASTDMLYDAACVYARSAAVTADAQQAEQYADRAVELLRGAIAKGYNDADHVMKDADLEVLRSREDFKTLLTELKTENAAR